MKKNIKKGNYKCTLSGVSGSATIISNITNKTTSTDVTWKGGWATDNFGTYYLDENNVKHYH